MLLIKEKIVAANILGNDRKKQIQFIGLFVTLLVLSLTYSLYHKEGSGMIRPIALTLLLGSLTYPKITKPLLFIWMLFGLLLSEITSFIMLFIVFYFILTPIALIKKKTQNTGVWNAVKRVKNYKNMY